jgi:8-oxo-dGTP pyrophosphatase MutT (NUDIX family)
MEDLLKNQQFAAAYERLASVTLNPRRHTAGDARSHSDAVAAMAARLGAANRCSAAEVALLGNLGHAHDIGKITGTARPARSLDVLAECGVSDRAFLALVKWHDTSLPWHRSAGRGEPPSEKAWRRLASEVDVRLLCVFMVADRVDAPGGWRRNAPTAWFIAEARSRGLIDDLVLDLDDHPSEVCAGAALLRHSGDTGEVLVTRTRAASFELPKGGIEWDELPGEAAVRELREEAGVEGDLRVDGVLGHVEYFAGSGSDRHLKRVVYHAVVSAGTLALGALPAGTRERRWLRKEDLDSVSLVNEGLRPLLRTALDGETRSGRPG